jgi:hypothetical protein
MSLIDDYSQARRDELTARIRRVLTLRAIIASGLTQREIAEQLGITQPAVSQQLHATSELESITLEFLVEAAAPVLKRITAERGFTDLAIFGSVARGESRADSDIDFLVQPPIHASIKDLVAIQEYFETVLAKSVDVVSYGGLKPLIDDDIRRDMVRL